MYTLLSYSYPYSPRDGHPQRTGAKAQFIGEIDIG